MENGDCQGADNICDHYHQQCFYQFNFGFYNKSELTIKWTIYKISEPLFFDPGFSSHKHCHTRLSHEVRKCQSLTEVHIKEIKFLLVLTL